MEHPIIFLYQLLRFILVEHLVYSPFFICDFSFNDIAIGSLGWGMCSKKGQFIACVVDYFISRCGTWIQSVPYSLHVLCFLLIKKKGKSTISVGSTYDIQVVFSTGVSSITGIAISNYCMRALISMAPLELARRQFICSLLCYSCCTMYW